MESELSRVVDALPGLVWTAQPDGHIDFINQRWCEYTGLSVDEAHGGGWLAAIHPEDLPELLERWRCILACGEPCEMEARLRRFDGAYRWFLIRTCPLASATGQIVKWCGVNTEIEDRRRAEEALHTLWWLWPPGRERHFRSIADGIPALIALRTPTGEVKIVNRHVLHYFDATLEELNEWSMAATVHPDDLPAFIAAWRGAVETGRAFEMEGRHRRADGAYRWFQMRGFPLRDTEGRVVLWYLLDTDIDDRKQVEALLAGEKRLLEMVVLGCPLPVVVNALCALLDATAEGCFSSVLLLDRTGRRVRQAIAPGLPSSYNDFLRGWAVSCPEGPCGLAASLKTQVIVSDVSSDTRWDRNGWPAVALSHGLKACWSSPILSLSGELLGTFAIYRREAGSPTSFHQALIQQFTHIASIAIGAIQDVTQRRLSEAALDKVRSELAHVARVSSLGALTASIAHEVNQPLSGIITNASTCLRMLAADPPNVDGARETARRTIRDGNRASDVITRLRALFAKKDATTEQVDLNEATREVIALSWSELQRNRVILRSDLVDDLPPVIGDRVQLQQVILNLLLNASDAMSGIDDRPRQLVIRTDRDEDDRVRLSVQDVGVGFEPQAVDRLFDAFYTTKSGGMGIGLSVSRSIIENHHGRLWAVPNEGPGATFLFSIPHRPEAVTGAHSLGVIRAPAVTNAQPVMRNP